MQEHVRDALEASHLSIPGRRRILALIDRRRLAKAMGGEGMSYEQSAKDIAELVAAEEASETAEASKPASKLLAQLAACFYGTPELRADMPAGSRDGRGKDGWRHGASHPFRVKVKDEIRTYDVLP